MISVTDTAINARMLMTTNSASGPHNGIVTHHHDQVIAPASLSVMNIKNNTIPSGKVQDVLDDCCDIVLNCYNFS